MNTVFSHCLDFFKKKKVFHVFDMKLSVEESPLRARMKKSLVPKKAKEKETGLVYVRCVLDPVP